MAVEPSAVQERLPGSEAKSSGHSVNLPYPEGAEYSATPDRRLALCTSLLRFGSARPLSDASAFVSSTTYYWLLAA